MRRQVGDHKPLLFPVTSLQTMSTVATLIPQAVNLNLVWEACKLYYPPRCPIHELDAVDYLIVHPFARLAYRPNSPEPSEA